MQKILVVLASLILLAVAGCDAIYGDSGYIHNRSNQYLSSRQGNALVVPQNLNHSQISVYYQIPDAQGELGVSMAAPGSAAERSGLSRHSAGLPIQPPIAPQEVAATIREGEPVLVLHQEFKQAWSFVGSALQRQRLPILIHKRELSTYFIADIFMTDDKIERDTPIRQVHLVPHGTLTEISVTDNEGHKLNVATSKRLLTDIQNGLMGKRKKRFFGLL